MLHIKPTDRVLEIGSGDRPRKRSNVLCDKYIHDNYQRALQAKVVIDRRPFVVADGLALPFKDKSFDYVIASHILEHVNDPHKFVSELTRVASAGYIESPSELGERIFGWPYHKWIARVDGDTIVLRQRTEDPAFGDYFHRKYATDLNFAEFVDSNFSDFYVQHEWDGTIKLRVEKHTSSSVNFNTKMHTIRTHSALRHAGLTVSKSASTILLRVVRHFRKFEK
jgi:SAM-dependent methyltransferase